MPIINVKKCKMCAFCINWDDPDNRLISPSPPENNLWDYDNYANKMCSEKGSEVNASSYCNKYRCKVIIN